MQIPDKMVKQILDIGERALWTAIQAAAGFLAAVQTDNVYIGVGTATVAAVLKGFVATKLGNGTASTLPSQQEPEYFEPDPAIEGDTGPEETYPPDLEVPDNPEVSGDVIPEEDL